jgi:hypothetical protein
MDTHAPVGNVSNDTVERRGAIPELDLRHTSDAVARRLASFLKLLQHVALLHVTAAPQDRRQPL